MENMSVGGSVAPFPVSGSMSEVEGWIPADMPEIPVQAEGANMFALADRLRDLKIQKDNLKEQTKEVNAELEIIEQQLVDLMVNEELHNFDRAGNKFYLTRKVYASAVPERKPELFGWLRKEGHGDMIQETVNANTLAAFVRELLDNSEEDELPEDLSPLLNVTRKPTVGMRKAGRGKKK